jgi:protoporphyrinogen/coproporphyrinogen III oxidase
MTRPVVVVGGGITGLVAARTLARTGVPVILLEASDRLGGKILTSRYKGAALEAGPDWFLTRTKTMIDLCRELGLAGDLVEPNVAGALIWSHGKLHRTPAEFVRGVPTSARGVLKCELLSLPGRLRALADVVLPGPLEGRDISIGALIRRRFGPELLSSVVDPILAASRSGAADSMSLAAAAPEIDAAARSSRSVIRGLRQAESDPGNEPAFLGLTGGMDSLVTALQVELRDADVRLKSPVRAIEATGDGFHVVTGSDAVDAQGVIVALPPPIAAPTVESLDAKLTKELAAIRYTSGVVVSFVYPPGSIASIANASGVLIPSSSQLLLTACAWYSAKWANARPTNGSIVIRCFAGRSPDDPVLEMSDEDIAQRLESDVATILGIKATPQHSVVTRWDNALPLYEVGHLERVDRIEKLEAAHPGLALAGAGYRGSGLPDCVVSAKSAAEKVRAR